MNPVRYAVERPYTVAVGVILALLFSVLAYLRIPVQLKPSVEPPIITLTSVYPGAGPVEVEEQISRELEDLLQSVDGLQKLTSVSQEGLSTVTLEYEWGVDKNRALVDVVNKLSQLPDFPPDAERPVASLTGEMGADMSMWILARSHYSENRVRQIVEEDVEPQLERVEGVANLLVVGGAEREIRVLVDPDRLAARGVRWDELAEALRRGWTDLRGGTVETATRQLVVRTEGRSPEVTEIAEIVVRRAGGGTILVGDVARVVDSYEETTSIVRSEGQRAVAIGVGRETGANVVRMIEGVEQQLQRLNESFASRGVDVQLEPVYRDTTYLQQAMDFVWSSLLLGSGLAVLVLLLFLRSLRSILIIAVTIPISLITVFWIMDALGRSLNVISLAGLAFASGMVVDNAIVVLENIFRYLERGRSPREAAEIGGREVWGGVLASTLTTVAVFLPVLGIEEEAGQLFRDLALALAAAVGVSLVAALLVVPPLSVWLYRKGTQGRAERGPTEPRRAARYGALVRGLVQRDRRAVLWKLALLLAVIGGSLWMLRIVPPAGYLPTGNSNLIFYFGQPIPGTRPEAVESNLRELEQWLLDQPDAARYFLVVAPMFNGGGVILKDEYASGEGLLDFQQRFLPICTTAPGFRFLIPMQFSLFLDSGKQFTLEITGPDLSVLARTAGRLQAALNQWPGVQPFGVQSDYVEGRPELRVQADAHRAGEAGMAVQEVGAIVETAVAGRRVATFSDGGRDYDLVLVAPPERVPNAAALASLPLITPRGERTTLSAVAEVVRTSGPLSINRLERERAITLTVNLQPQAVLQAVLDDVRTKLVDAELAGLPSQYRIRLGGSADKFGNTLRALTASFWLAVLLCYLLLVALFRSWLSPFVILVTVPLALSGGLAGITLASRFSSNASYDLLAMMGFVILAGVVVNNAILIVHQTNNLREQGVERRAALAEAARSRLRPILMSVITSVFGMLPLAVGSGAGAELYQGLAAVVTGGLVVSTLFTLFLVPALLSLGWDLAEALGRSAPASAAP